MLKTAGIINIIIAALHLVGLLCAWPMFRATGIEKEMRMLAETHQSLPYLMTAFVALIFLLFGLYALSATGHFRELPKRITVLWGITAIYLLRGVGELLFDWVNDSLTATEALYSILAIIIGGMYWYGTRKLQTRKRELKEN